MVVVGTAQTAQRILLGILSEFSTVSNRPSIPGALHPSDPSVVISMLEHRPKMKQTLLLKLIVVVSAFVYRSDGFKVRFDNGSEFEGRVEIEYHNGMCLVLADKIVAANGHLNLIANDKHMCRQLDFESTQESVSGIRRNEAYYGGNNGTIWFTSMSCTGTESAQS